MMEFFGEKNNGLSVRYSVDCFLYDRGLHLERVNGGCHFSAVDSELFSKVVTVRPLISAGCETSAAPFHTQIRLNGAF